MGIRVQDAMVKQCDPWRFTYYHVASNRPSPLSEGSLFVPYMRIQESKFWSWVTASVLIGLVIGGAAGFFFSQAAATSRINAAKSEFSKQAEESGAKITALQAKLASQEASAAALSEANSQLDADLAAAKADARKATPSSTTTTAAVVVSRDITPSSASASETITLTAKVKGPADKVTMRLTGKSVGFDQTYTLKKVSTSGSTVTWRLSIKAPGKKGEYRYYATAFAGDTEVTMVGASPSTLKVN